MSKLELFELPESVQVIAADMLKQQMNLVSNGEWCAEAKRIANAFLALYESTDVEVKIQGAVTISKDDIESAIAQKFPGNKVRVAW